MPKQFGNSTVCPGKKKEIFHNKVLFASVWSMLHMFGGFHFCRSSALSFSPSLLVLSALLSLTAPPFKYHRIAASLSSIEIPMPTTLLNLLTECLFPAHCSPAHAPAQARPSSIQAPYARIDLYLFSFIDFIGQLWNRLLVYIFPPFCHLHFFKRTVSRHHSYRPWLSLSASLLLY